MIINLLRNEKCITNWQEIKLKYKKSICQIKDTIESLSNVEEYLSYKTNLLKHFRQKMKKKEEEEKWENGEKVKLESLKIVLKIYGN